MCGRWVLIVVDKDNVTLFNEFRMVCVKCITLCRTRRRFGAFLIRQIVKGILPLLGNKNAEETTHTAYMKNVIEYWWPGNSSPYAGIMRLPPNHAIDLKTKCHWRFWPTKELNIIPLKDGAKRIAELLRSIVYSGHRRFPLALALTSGWDSRTLLAATSEFLKKPVLLHIEI